jgi:hypothetical protein
VSRPWLILRWIPSALLGLVGLGWPTYVVLTHWLDGRPWWQIFLVTVVIGVVAAPIGHGLRWVVGGRNAGEEVLNAVGFALSGTLFGALMAFVVAPFTGRPGLMPSALLLGMSAMAVSAAVGYGISRLYVTWGEKSLTLGVPYTPKQVEEGWQDWSVGSGRTPEELD